MDSSYYPLYPNASGTHQSLSYHDPHRRAQHHPMAAPALLSSQEESNIFGFLDAFDWDLDESVGAGMPPFDPSLPSGPTAGSQNTVQSQQMNVDPYFLDGELEWKIINYSQAHVCLQPNGKDLSRRSRCIRSTCRYLRLLPFLRHLNLNPNYNINNSYLKCVCRLQRYPIPARAARPSRS